MAPAGSPRVGARFTLDAMPGKQMAIDADLNSGLIDEEEARRRRAEVHAEADFHGAMDGASKFVKGDAIAAIVITLVNLLGGFAIGVAQYGMPFGEAINTYSLLSIGDGLVSQVPALLLSVATGLIVTRAVADSDMGSDIVGQIFKRRMPLRVAGFGALALCAIPGLPKLPFLVAGGLMLLGASRIDESAGDGTASTDAETAAGELAQVPDTPEALINEIRVDPLGLELSADLIDLVDARSGGDLLDRVKALRRKVAGELGIVIPPVRTRDNLELPASTYAITLYGAELARGEAPRGTVLAIGEFLDSLPGTPTREPVFGLDAKWIPAELRHQAEIGGATVVDRASVVTTHLAEVVHQHASRLLGREDVRLLTDVVKRSHPVVIEELTPTQLPLGEVQRVLRALLDERIPIRDLVRIFEALSVRAAVSKDLDGLVEAARSALEPALAAPYVTDGVLHAISFEPLLEQHLLEALRPTEQGAVVVLDPDLAQRLLVNLAQAVQAAENTDVRPVLVCAPALRAAVRRLVAPTVERLPVLSYAELGAAHEVRSVAVVSATGARPALGAGV